METIEDVKRLRAFLADDFQIGLPHIGADERDLRSQFIANDRKESLKRFDGSFAAHPEQAGDAEIDLVNERQILVPFCVLDFGDSDSVDLAEHPVCQPEGDDVFHGIEHLLPGSAERFGSFFPRKPACPTGQEQHIRSGQSAFPIAPGNLLDDDRPAARAIDAPHRVKKKNQKAPERDKFEPALGELIVSGGRLMATGTNCCRTLAWTHRDLNPFVIGAEARLLVNESRKTMPTIYNRNKLNHQLQTANTHNYQ